MGRMDFESAASAIPPLRRGECKFILSRGLVQYSYSRAAKTDDDCPDFRNLIVIFWSVLLPGKEIDIVPDPQLRPGFPQKLLKPFPRRLRNPRRFFAFRHGIQLEILGIVVEIAAQYDASSLRKLHIKRLMPGCMTGCEQEHDRTIAEHVVVAFDDFRFAVLESGIRGVYHFRLHVGAEHHAVVSLMDEECCARKIVGVADVIWMRM